MIKIQKEKPLVSVIIPVRNGGKYLRESLESIFRQTFQDFEVLLIDDASTDNTWEILKEYKNRFNGRITLFKLKKQSGAYTAINFAFPKSSGELIALMDSDDIAHPKRLEKQVEYLRKHNDVVILGTQANIIDGEGKPIGKKQSPLTHTEIYKQFALVHPMIHPSCMIRKKLLPRKNRIYEDRFGVNDDYFTFFNLLNCGKFANLPEFMLDYRVHKENSSMHDLKKVFFNTLKIRMQAKKEFGYRFSSKAKLLVGMQLVIILLTPGKLIFPLYLMLRGITFPSISLLGGLSRIPGVLKLRQRFSLNLRRE